MTLLNINGISVGYGKTPVLQDVSFSVENGCITGILGANGSGKTTLLKTISNLLPHKGTCTLENTELEKLSSRQLAKLVSYIPQRSGISIDVSALDVVLMGFNPHLGILEHPAKTMIDSAMLALSEAGLAGFEDKSYLQLSEGQKQLCILARTIVSGSRLLLLDEPESALDFNHRYKMLEKIRYWVGQTNGAAVVTLHDPGLALNYCDKLILLKDGHSLDILTLKESSLEEIENGLSLIYGPVSLCRCTNRGGRNYLTLLKEDDE